MNINNISIEEQNKSITHRSNSNFRYSVLMLNKEKRNEVRALYTFCRLSDDIVDNDLDDLDVKIEKLRKWKQEFHNSLNGKSENQFLVYLADVIAKHRINSQYFIDLIEGMKMDLTKSNYNSFSDLYEYLYRVSAVVGLIFIEIIGYKNHETKVYAEKLGIALQLTNIIRDIKTDSLNNRIYIPQEDFLKFNYSVNDLKNYTYNQNFDKLIQFECERAINYYSDAREILPKEDYQQMLPARIIDRTYFTILKKLNANKKDLLKKEVTISKFHKLIVFLSLFLKAKINFSG